MGKSWRSIAFMLLLWKTYHIASGQNDECVLSGLKEENDFPNLEKEGVLSYQLSVEHTIPNAKQTGYYEEYYDISERQGRVDSHISGTSIKYIYYPKTNEAFEILGRNCKSLNVTNRPEFMDEYHIDWTDYSPNDIPKIKRGPSAMFQIALNVWKDPKRSRTSDMAYMGETKETVRGLKAQYWRRCMKDSKHDYVDYYFTTDDHEDAFGFSNLKRIPLRVVFKGKNLDKNVASMSQSYDILSFQPYVSEPQPYQLPVGAGCRRSDQFEDLDDTPDLPNFNDKNLMFSADVIYQTNSIDDVWSYSSSLMMALDVETQHLAYFFSPWTNSTKDDVDVDPEVSTPQFVVFDTIHGYAYKTNLNTGSCSISRSKKFFPMYDLPKNRGSIDLTSPAVILTNNELSYVTESTDRGLGVHVFENTFEDYPLFSRVVPKVIVSHSYLKENEVERNVVSVKEALTRADFRLITPEKKLEEQLTFNFYGLTTQLIYKNYIFDISRCFKNDDDYMWATFGFATDAATIAQIERNIPAIQGDIINYIQVETKLNAVRIPNILVDFTDAVYVSLMILEKPYILLDYDGEEKDFKITDSADFGGVYTFDDCANMCVEEKEGCWGFSICGATCTFATTETPNATVVAAPNQNCSFYRRYNSSSYIPSLSSISEDLRAFVASNEMKLNLLKSNGDFITLFANFIEITNPGEDDELFSRLEFEANPRMKTLKAGYRLKESDGVPVKNLGKLSYAECQRVCLDFKDCESISFCLDNSECRLSQKYSDEIDLTKLEEKNTCVVRTRKYADNFERSPGNILSRTATKILDIVSAEDCARACLKTTEFVCSSFDHCANTKVGGCKLHNVYYPNANTKENVFVNNSNCGHYFKKYSKQFKVSYEKKFVVSNLPLMTNFTLEECAKTCVDYGNGTCYGFDFCQSSAVFATTCILLDKATGDVQTAYSPICNNYKRDYPLSHTPRPYSTSYAGGIGFLCFIVGAIIGAGVVFVIAYVRMNRRQ